jgi:hypothetical protein
MSGKRDPFAEYVNAALAPLCHKDGSRTSSCVGLGFQKWDRLSVAGPLAIGCPMSTQDNADFNVLPVEF